MSKRELEQLNAMTDIEGPRTKRRREAATDADVSHSDPITEGGDESGEGGGSKEDVYELGLKLYETVKDAVNKEGRSLSLAFLRRPSKRLYPDYYQIIQQPIALEDIRKHLDNGTYATLDAVKQDFELCFNNAKQYNMKESDIWRDAKDLAKLVNKTYSKLVPSTEDVETGDGEGKKSKPPSLTRLIKSRLQKLAEKTDDTGRVLSREFMDLPSKKEWPLYYKQIKQPQCLENIFKHIKRKEYTTAAEFAADVELVFANAMAFNQEHTVIWEDAKTLRDHFRTLVADLPPPFDLPQYATVKPKIKIKPQASHHAVSATATINTASAQPSTSTSQMLRIPAVKQAKPSSPAPAPTPTPTISLPDQTATPPPQVPLVPVTQVPQRPPMAPQPVSHVKTTFSHYPNVSYTPTPVPTLPPGPSSVLNAANNAMTQAHSASNSPAPPPLHPSHCLKSISFVVQPRGRTVYLDHEVGVKSWAIRLVPGDTEVHISNVTFLGNEEDGSSEDEEEEEHEEEEEEADASTTNGRKRTRATRGRGRNVKVKKTAPAKKKRQKLGPVQVKLNGSVVKEQEDESGKWVVSPAVGSSTIEVGENGGLIWKVYVQRMD